MDMKKKFGGSFGPIHKKIIYREEKDYLSGC